MSSIDELQRLMGVKFKNADLLSLALTHTSYAHEHKLPLEQSNERLEFLGDAVLGICIAEMLIRAFPEESEGVLSKRRAALVNQKQLASLAERIQIGPNLRLGKGEDKTGGRSKASLLGDAFEAVIGALYLDQGLEVVQRYIERIFAELLPVSKRIETSQDYKTRLQEYHQRIYKKSPRYVLVKESGPDHSKVFEVRIEFNGKSLGSGKGKSKREAEQDAARQAFDKLQVKDEEVMEPRTVKSKKSREKDREASPRKTKTSPPSDASSNEALSAVATAKTKA